MFVALENGTAELYRIGERQPRLTFRYQESVPRRPAHTGVLLRGHALSIGSDEGTIGIWDLEGELMQELFLEGPKSELFELIFTFAFTKHCTVQTLSLASLLCVYCLILRLV